MGRKFFLSERPPNWRIYKVEFVSTKGCIQLQRSKTPHQCPVRRGCMCCLWPGLLEIPQRILQLVEILVQWSACIVSAVLSKGKVVASIRPTTFPTVSPCKKLREAVMTCMFCHRLSLIKMPLHVPLDLSSTFVPFSETNRTHNTGLGDHDEGKKAQYYFRYQPFLMESPGCSRWLVLQAGFKFMVSCKSPIWPRGRKKTGSTLEREELPRWMGPVRIRHSSHDFGWQSSHSVDLAGWLAKMACIESWIPRRDAHKPRAIGLAGNISSSERWLASGNSSPTERTRTGGDAFGWEWREHIV